MTGSSVRPARTVRSASRRVRLSLVLLAVVAACAPMRREGRWPTPAPGEATFLPLPGGGGLHYQTAGAGEALVLIHGGFGDRRMWDDVFLPLADDWAVVRYDHRGFGRSTRPDAVYSPVRDLLRLLDHLHIGRAYLVGNSLGGELALDFALQHPERVAALVMVASGPQGLPVPQAEIDDVLAVFEVARGGDLSGAAERWLAHPMVAVTRADPRRAPRLERMVRQNASMFTLPFELWPGEVVSTPTSERLERISVPTLVIVGTQDVPVVREAAAFAAAGLPDAELVELEGADHLPQMSQTSRFLFHVRRFLLARDAEARAIRAKQEGAARVER